MRKQILTLDPITKNPSLFLSEHILVRSGSDWDLAFREPCTHLKSLIPEEWE
jgi:hypothetical protein